MAGVDIGQPAGLSAILHPKQSRVAIVAETAGELLIEYLNEIGRPCRRVMIAELNPTTTKLQFQVSTLQEGYDPVTYF
jgi:hypothetical protein